MFIETKDWEIVNVEKIKVIIPDWDWNSVAIKVAWIWRPIIWKDRWTNYEKNRVDLIKQDLEEIRKALWVEN